jgi:hypothetical protein
MAPQPLIWNSYRKLLICKEVFLHSHHFQEPSQQNHTKLFKMRFRPHLIEKKRFSFFIQIQNFLAI